MCDSSSSLCNAQSCQHSSFTTQYRKLKLRAAVWTVDLTEYRVIDFVHGECPRYTRYKTLAKVEFTSNRQNSRLATSTDDRLLAETELTHNWETWLQFPGNGTARVLFQTFVFQVFTYVREHAMTRVTLRMVSRARIRILVSSKFPNMLFVQNITCYLYVTARVKTRLA